MAQHHDRMRSGEAIAAARRAAGIASEAELGRRIGATQQSVQRWEQGQPLTMDNLVALTRELPELRPLEVVYALWSEIAAADPVPADIRELLTRASPAQIKAIRADIEELVGMPAAARESAGLRAVRTGRRRAARSDAERRKPGRGHR